MEEFDFGMAPPAPLAELLRPKTLDEVVGQESLLGKDGRLRLMLAHGNLGSVILWGPPGTGKTMVFPVPGGPHNMTDPKLPCASISRRRPSLPSKLSCPTTSSSVLGRNNSANGAGGAMPKSNSSIGCIIYEARPRCKEKRAATRRPFKSCL